MVTIAVLSDCDAAVKSTLQTVGSVLEIADLGKLDPTAIDVLVVDWRNLELDENYLDSFNPPDLIPCIGIVGKHQKLPDALSLAHVSDLVTLEEVSNTAFRWKFEQLMGRYKQTLDLAHTEIPEIQLLQTVVNQMADWVIIKDLEHRFLMVSDDFQTTVGLSKDEIIGKNDLEIGTDPIAVLGDPRTGWKGFWEQDDAVVAAGVPTCEENLDWRAFSSERRYKRTLRIPLVNAQGTVYALLVVSNDITDQVLADRSMHARSLMLRRVTEEKMDAEQRRQIAEQAIHAKNNFLAAASHDLRQPLHALGLFLSVLERRLTDSENLDVLQKIKHSSEALNTLFNSLLDISRLDAGVVEVVPQTFVIKDLLANLRDEFTQLALDKSLTVDIEITEFVVKTDPVLLARILRNLLHNAITHTESGKVTVKCKKLDDMVHIEVCDTGPGIPTQEHDAVFSEYYQLEKKINSSSGGLGLGLSIVKKLVALLDINLSMRSAVGHGSTFEVVIPKGELHDIAQPSIPAHYRKLAGHQILFIDDEADIRDGLRLILDAFDCKTVTAESAASALNLLTEQNMEPDIMIVDYRLNDGLTGTAAIELVREHFARAIPAIIVTGDTSKSRLRDAMNTGCRLLHKPVGATELIKTIAAVLDERLFTH